MTKGYCSKCGKPTEMKEGDDTFSIKGIQFDVRFDDLSVAQQLFWDKQLGKYAGETHFEFCWECWLDSLFNENQRVPIFKEE